MRLSLPALVIVGAATLSLSCHSTVSSKGVSIDSSLQSIVPPTATVLVGVAVGRLVTTDLYRRHAADLDLRQLDDSMRRLDFDPRRDVKELLFASDGPRSLLLATGQFQESKLKAQLAGSGGRPETYHSYELLGADQYRVAILKSSTLVGGTGEAVKAGLDALDDNRGGVAPDLQTRLESLPKPAQIWIASRQGLPFLQGPMRSDVRSALSNIVNYISGVQAALEINSDLRLTGRIDCISPTGAQRVHDALRGAIGLARLSTKDDQADLLKVYDAIQVNQTGDSVEVKAALNSAEIDQLIRVLPQARERAGRLAH